MAARRPDIPLSVAGDAAQDPKGQVSSGALESVWTATHPPIWTTPLQADDSAQVCIVGAGIAGMTTAYLLARDGVDVLVLEDGAIGSGETGRTTAHFTNALDDRYAVIAKKHGEEAARLAAQSHTEAIETVHDIVRRERIACHLDRVDGYLFLHPSDKPKSLDEELEACRKVGLDVEMVDSAPHFESGRAIRFPGQLQLHILEYLDGLRKAIVRYDGRIHTKTHVRFPEGKVEANGHAVKAGRTIVCSNAPVSTKLSIHAKQLAFRTYVVAAPIPNEVPAAMWWDTGDYEAPSPFPPYHYVRTQRFAGGKRMLIVGGQDHKVGSWETMEVDPFEALESWMRQRFPEAGAVQCHWSGEVFEPADHLAFIGREPVSRGRYLAAGDSGNGMTHGTLAGIILSRLAQGRSVKYASLYDPTRRNLRSSGAVLREHLATVKKLGQYLHPGDIRSAADLEPGQGAILGAGKPKAVYRDDGGFVHACSAICPHLGCVVAWNPMEKSFDCPCHGSRFTALGHVVCGPANADLEGVELDAKEMGPVRPGRPRKETRREAGAAVPTGAVSGPGSRRTTR